MSAQKYVDHIRSKKSDLIAAWLEQKKIVDLFADKRVPIRLFKHHFAPRIIEHHLALLEGAHEDENCPTMAIVIHFFKNARFYPHDIYLLCSSLKKEMLLHLFRAEMTHLFEVVYHNFETALYKLLRELYLSSDMQTAASCPLINDYNEHHPTQKLPSKCHYDLESMLDAIDINYLEELEERLYYFVSKNTPLDDEFYYIFSLVSSLYTTLLIDETIFYALSNSFKKALA